MEDPSDSMHTYADLANASYDRNNVPDGYDVDSELSNRNRLVLVNKQTGKATISYRGTDLKNNRKGDLGTDALLALGLTELSARFRNAKKHARAVVGKYGKGNVDTTGHSLGGSQSLYVNSKLGLPSVSFNAGVSPGFVKKTALDTLSTSLFKRPARKTATVYTTGLDPISALSPLLPNATTRVVKPTTKNVHSLANFMRRR